MKSLVLYTTAGCHLCEQAKQIILPLIEATDFSLQEIDIAEDETLLAAYGLTIPVVENPVSGRQFNWPFNDKQVMELIEE